MKLFTILLLLALFLLATASIANGRKDPGEYWGEKVIEALGVNLQLNQEGTPLVNEPTLSIDFGLRPNPALLLHDHKAISTKEINDLSTSKSFVQDFMPRPNPIATKHSLTKVNIGSSTSNSFVKDFEPKPNPIAWKHDH